MSTEEDIILNRKQKLAEWRSQGEAFPSDFRREHLAKELHERFDGTGKLELEADRVLTAVSGRIMLRRVMGKASFITLEDMTGQIQCYVQRDSVGVEAYEDFKSLWDIGDIVGIVGSVMKTNKGELSIHADRMQLLNKTLRPLPEKYHGLVDKELKYRKRYLDLIMNSETKRLFETRAKVITQLRKFFDNRSFLEVETPMMHVLPGGAAARPFSTHHNALDLDLYMRVAPELFLKRLVIGGYERVYEINRNFRNEGLSTRHNPEFTMLEFYLAYSDFKDLIHLTWELLKELVLSVSGSEAIEYQSEVITFQSEPTLMTMLEAIQEYSGIDSVSLFDKDKLAAFLNERGVVVNDGWGLGKLQTELFEVDVEEKLIQPTFITHYPTEVSPLSRRSDGDLDLADRFELFISGREIANGFSELNDPEDQASRFEEQALVKQRGDDEAMYFDSDYIEALEYGLPPTAGEGIGIDRLVMLLTNSASIRDVLLFPLMKPNTDRE